MARRRTRVVISPSLEKDLLRSSELREKTTDFAHRIAFRAEQMAPFKRIAEQIEVETALDSDFGFVARVVSNDWISWFWEAGTINHEARPFLRPAAIAEGASFRPRS